MKRNDNRKSKPGAAYPKDTRPLLALLLCLVLWSAGRMTASSSPSPALAQATNPAQRLKSFIESPPVIESLKACVETRLVAYTFLPNDIANLESFAKRLKSPVTTEPLANYLSSKLSRSCQVLLSNYTGGPDLELKAALATDLNRLINNGLIYQPARFERVKLSRESTNLISTTLFGPDLTRLNRQLLLEAFPNELSNTNHPLTHQTYLEIRYQPGAFYMKTATNLDGLSDALVRPVSLGEVFAGGLRSDSMAAGRYGNNCWFIGNGVFDLDTLSDQMARNYECSNRNPVILQMPMFIASRILNFGIPCETLGTIRWKGDTTSSVDQAGQAFTAEMKLGPSGRPIGLEILYPSYAYFGITQQFKVDVSYSYTEDIPGWDLPSTIRIGTNWVAKILSVSLAARPFTASAYSPNRFVNKKSGLAMLVRRRDSREISHTQYLDLKHGLRQIAGVWLTNQELRAGGIVSFSALTAIIVAVGAAIQKQKQQTNIQ